MGAATLTDLPANALAQILLGQQSTDLCRDLAVLARVHPDWCVDRLAAPSRSSAAASASPKMAVLLPRVRHGPACTAHPLTTPLAFFSQVAHRAGL